MEKKDDKPTGEVIRINEPRIKDHPSEMVRGALEETLNTLLDAEADQLSVAARCEQSAGTVDEGNLKTDQGRWDLPMVDHVSTWLRPG